MNGEMAWLKQHDRRTRSPQLMSDVRSVIMLCLNYYQRNAKEAAGFGQSPSMPGAIIIKSSRRRLVSGDRIRADLRTRSVSRKSLKAMVGGLRSDAGASVCGYGRLGYIAKIVCAYK